jgi:isopentenyl phosphate kinase
MELDNMKMSKLHFLKLGGSLITDKNEAHTHRPDVLARLGREIAAALEQDPSIKVVLGHGSGSFGMWLPKNMELGAECIHIVNGMDL